MDTRARLDAQLSAPLAGAARRQITQRTADDEMALFLDASRGV